MRSAKFCSTILVALTAMACHENAVSEQKSEALSVIVAKVEQGSVTDIVEAAGPLQPPPGFDAKLGALVPGRLATVRVAEGDHVAAGQLLASVDTRPFQDAVAQAEANVAGARAQEENAAAKFSRAQKLFEAGIVARSEVEDAKAQDVSAHAAVSTTRAALSTAKNQLARAELRAPFAGVVAHVFAAPGEPMSGDGKPILEIARTQILELRAPLSASSASRVQAEQRAQVIADGLSDHPFEGTVVAVAPVVDPQSGAALVRVRIDNPQGLLKGGAFARARIAVNVHTNVLTIPREALLADGMTSDHESNTPRFAVATVAADGFAHRQSVTVGAMDTRAVEIRSGLTLGDEVIVQGGYALPDGTKVRVAREAASDGGALSLPPTK